MQINQDGAVASISDAKALEIFGDDAKFLIKENLLAVGQDLINLKKTKKDFQVQWMDKTENWFLEVADDFFQTQIVDLRIYWNRFKRLAVKCGLIKPEIHSKDFVSWEDVKSEISVGEVLNYYLSAPTKTKNFFLCPFHNDSRPSLTFSEKTGRWRCFGCGENGQAVNFVSKFEGVDFKTSLKIIKNKFL